MKDNTSEYADPPRLALWTGLAIALGIILHRIFFLVAALVALVAPLRWLVEWLRKHEESTTLQHRHS